MYKNKKIAVVIPAYNEEKDIGQVIDRIPDYIDKIIVIDDGSNDQTASISKNKGAVVISHFKNKGVGAAFNTGVKEILKLKIDIMINIDADNQFNPEDIEKLIIPIHNKQADFVTASRFIDKDYYPRMSNIKFLGNKFMARFVSWLTGVRFYDVSCGFRAYSRETLQRLNLFGDFTYTQETFIDLVFKNLTIIEVPVHVRGKRKHGKSKVACNLFQYGYRTLKIIIRTFRDYKPFRLFGYISLFLFFIGFALSVFLLIHYLQSGSFTPHKWAGFTAAFFISLSFFFLLIGFILDMFSRMRFNQEQILYELKKTKENE